MATDYSKTDEVVDELIRRYANSQEITIMDIVGRFFRGIYSYPDDVGMALAVAVSSAGLLGPHMQRQARRVNGDVDWLICLVIRNPQNLWFFLTKYKDYLLANGRLLAAQVSSSGGRVIGGILTGMALARVQAAAGVDPQYVTKWDRRAVKVSLFLLATYGAACHAALAGEREFLGVLHRMITGEIDPNVSRMQRELDPELRHDAPWRNVTPNDVDEGIDQIRPWLQGVCDFGKDINRY
jgi:hypothetical protein